MNRPVGQILVRVISAAIIILFAGTFHAYGKIHTSAEWDQTADFYSLKTYAWLPDPPERADDTSINYGLADPRIKGSVDIDLRLKGYEKVTEEAADFMVGYQIVREKVAHIAAINGFYGYSPAYDFWGRGMGEPGFSNTYIERFVQGTLILDIVDTALGRLIWRGYATAAVDPKARLEDKTEVIQDATEKILQNFPSRILE